MIAKFMTVLSFFLLIFCIIGCGDSSSIVKPEAQPAVSPVVFEDVLISENIRATPAVSVDTVAQPLPLKVEEVAGCSSSNCTCRGNSSIMWRSRF